MNKLPVYLSTLSLMKSPPQQRKKTYNRNELTLGWGCIFRWPSICPQLNEEGCCCHIRKTFFFFFSYFILSNFSLFFPLFLPSKAKKILLSPWKKKGKLITSWIGKAHCIFRRKTTEKLSVWRKELIWLKSLGFINVTHSADSVAPDKILSSYADLDYFPSENHTWWKTIVFFSKAPPVNLSVHLEEWMMWLDRLLPAMRTG